VTVFVNINQFGTYRKCDQIWFLYQSYSVVNFNILYKNI